MTGIQWRSLKTDGIVSNEACANCGKQGSDTVKLMDCTACRLVKYCGAGCQRAHRKEHEESCKQRAAELKDEQLYSQGLERTEGDFCPICTLAIPLPIQGHSIFNVCCMKRVCKGCVLAARARGMNDCPFCRTAHPGTAAERLAMIRVRVKKKDPEATLFLGTKYHMGELGLQKDVRKGVELYTEAAELGSIDAIYNLGCLYASGKWVEENKAKGMQLWQKAAMRGHVEGRHNLGMNELESGNYDRAVKHNLIAAKMGHNRSVEKIKEMFMAGAATKEQYAEALRGYQDAVEGMKSHDWEEAKRWWKARPEVTMAFHLR